MCGKTLEQENVCNIHYFLLIYESFPVNYDFLIGNVSLQARYCEIFSVNDHLHQNVKVSPL